MEDPKRIHKFLGNSTEDFQLWCARTEAALEAREVLHVVITDIMGEGIEKLSEENELAVAKARAIMIQGLGDKPLRLCLSDQKNPYQMYSRLKKRYAVSNVATKVQLQARSARLSYRGQPMSDYLAEFEEVYNRLAATGNVVTEPIQVATFLASFGDPSKSPYGYVISSLQLTEAALSWQTTASRLLQAYEDKVFATGGDGSQTPTPMRSSTVALTAKYRHPNHTKQQRYVKRPGNNRPERRRCYECEKIGHIAQNCPRRRGYGSGIESRSTNPVSDSMVNHTTMLVAQTRAPETILLLDSGASDHMVSNRNLLSNMKPIAPRKVVVGNGSVLTAAHRGVMTLLPRGNFGTVLSPIMVRDVLLVPQLQTNLVACSALCRQGFDVQFSNYNCFTTKDGITAFEGTEHNGLYYINADIKEARSEVAMSARTSGEVLWHNRLGHGNLDSIRELGRRGAVSGLDFSISKPSVKCEDCIKRKQHKHSLQSKSVRATQIGEVIHSDVCGPLSVESFGGAQYFVTFIDEFSGYITLVPIHRKSDVANVFKKYCVWLERKYECVIKRLHCDGGGEYIALKGYLEEQGIELDMAPPYTPELNGIAERANRTLAESARAMLNHGKMPKKFWAEAVVHAADLRNRFIAPREGSKTSYELMTKKVPRVDHLRVFGSLAWTYVPKEKRNKLEDKSKDGVIVGCYEDNQYKVWLRSTRQPVVSRYVTVLEDKFPSLEWYNLQEESDVVLLDSQSTVQEPRAEAEEGSGRIADDNRTMSEEPQVINNDLLTYTPAQASHYRLGHTGMNSPQTPAEGDQQSTESGAAKIPEVVTTRYPRRVRKQIEIFDPSSANTAIVSQSPKDVDEALNSDTASMGKDAIRSELDSLKKHNTWQISSIPEGVTAIPTRFVFTVKTNSDGTTCRYKARLVVKGYKQGHVDATFSPVVDFSTVRVALAVAVQRDWLVHQMDVRTAFLHGDIDSDVYVFPPPGSGIKLRDGTALKLQKGLYGLKQAPRLWLEKWEAVMVQVGFSRLASDYCFYRKGNVWIVLYVDDLLLMGPCLAEIEKVKVDVSEHLDIKDMGKLGSFLGIRFTRDSQGASLSQSHYVAETLMRYGMSSCRAVVTPGSKTFDSPSTIRTPTDQKLYQELVGSLLFLATRTRPDISAAVNVLCRYCSDASTENMVAAKRVLRYLQGTRHYVLRFRRPDGCLVAYADADWAGDVKDRKSTSGILIQFAGNTIFWKSSKQGSVALSTTEAEFVAASEACRTIVWIRALLRDLDYRISGPTPLLQDNQGAIVWGLEGVRHAKHIAIKFNYVKQLVHDGIIKLQYCPSAAMRADLPTKPLLRTTFEAQRHTLRVIVQPEEDGIAKRGS